ncbi:peroxiredoxin family protein [Demequina capsici]|uniref:Peroxiredoxin family protein n=1 Tax=Demequina capsici TaxID=3075620 RepID=A0AA96F512_9MICO|nr:peroxiredoxin family protein [Demequina sp. OYTSA14]WNM23932.1 peroxiredoxin family protein [Demequina sp. OYTSA14]
MTSGSATRNKRQRDEVLAAARAEIKRDDVRRRRIVGGIWAVGLLVLAGLVTAALLSSRPTTGDEASAATDFTLPLSTGGEVSLSDYAGSPVVLYFNEGAGCDSCLTQMAAIEADPDFAEAGIEVLPIVMNTADQINAERERLGVATPFALDDGTVSEAYGTLGQGMHEGLPGHGFVLIDADGTQLWYGNYPSMWLDPSELFDLVEAKL